MTADQAPHSVVTTVDLDRNAAKKYSVQLVGIGHYHVAGSLPVERLPATRVVLRRPLYQADPLRGLLPRLFDTVDSPVGGVQLGNALPASKNQGRESFSLENAELRTASIYAEPVPYSI